MYSATAPSARRSEVSISGGAPRGLARSAVPGAPERCPQRSAAACAREKAGLAKIVPDDGWHPASIFFQGMRFMLFGDPSLRLPAPAKEF